MTRTCPTIQYSVSQIIIGILLFFHVFPQKLSANPVPIDNYELYRFVNMLEQWIPGEMKKYDIPGLCIALVQHGEIKWVGAYGYADRELSRDMTTEALCRVESISKSVTAWGVMKLADKGFIRLEDPINKYLEEADFPGTDTSWRYVTIHQLLSHTAGLPLGTIGPSVEYPPFGMMPSVEEYLSPEIQLIYEPGTKFYYSNVGFNLLEVLIEKVSGQRFSSFMKEEILLPLGMNHSGFTFSQEELKSIPTGYETDGTPVPPYVYPVHASGGLMATVSDIARFLTADAGDGKHVLQPESLSRIYVPYTDVKGLYGFVTDGYGYGHFVEKLSDGTNAVWHGGQGHGWMTHFHLLPEKGEGIVLLTNSQRSWPFFGKILLTWTQWLDIPPVGMSRIIAASRIFQGMIILTILTAIFLLSHVLYGLIQGKRRFNPLSDVKRIKRLLLNLSGITILGVLIWVNNLPYFFLSSVFPVSTPFFGYGLLTLAAGFILLSLFPVCYGQNKPLKQQAIL
jgi:CubicO group peptidase (beta-lactamase class C family)